MIGNTEDFLVRAADAEAKPIETLTVKLAVDSEAFEGAIKAALAEAGRSIVGDRPITIISSRKGLAVSVGGRHIGFVAGQDSSTLHIAVPHGLTKTVGPSS